MELTRIIKKYKNSPIFLKINSAAKFHIKTNNPLVRVVNTLLTIAILSSSYFIVFKNNTSAAEWFNDNWLYRQKITLSAVSNSVSDIQIQLTGINTQTLVTATKLQSDCDDIRFTDIQGNLLSYWMEDDDVVCGSDTTTDIWVRLPLLESTGTTIYMYYGNPNAPRYENGSTTFDLFDDFESNVISEAIWTKSNTPTVASGVATFNDSESVYSKLDFTPNKKVIFRSSQAATSLANAEIGFTNNTSGSFTNDDSAFYQFDSSTGSNFERTTSNEGTSTSAIGNIAENTSYNEFEIGVRSAAVDFAINNSTDGNISTNIPDENMNVRISNSSASNINIDWIAVANYAPSLPSSITFDSEERGLSPIIHFDFDEGYGTSTTDKSGLGNNGTLVNGPVWTDNCVKGKCLKFDGVNDYVNVTSPKSLPGGNSARTLSAWINPEIVSGSNSSGTIMGYGNGNTSGQEFLFQYGSSGPIYLFTDGVNAGNNLTYNVSERPTDLSWNYVVFTMDSSMNWKLYVNLVLKKQGTFSGINTTTSNFRVGARTDTASQADYFWGLIDEVKLFDRVIDATEMKQEFNMYNSVLGASKNSVRDGQMGWWKMDEPLWNGTANEVIDHSTRNLHGTSVNGATTIGTGYFGNAGNFDGTNDHVNLNHAYLSMTSTDSYSISAWVRSSSPTSGTIRTIFTRYESGTAYPYVLKLHSDNTWQFAISDGTNTPTASSNISINNSWHFLTAVRDVSTDKLYLYVDGQLVNETIDTTTGSITNAGSTKIGAYTSAGTNPWRGSLDEVMFFKKALSANDVKKLYEYTPEPAGHWKFDEQSGSSAFDVSTNNLVGTLNNITDNDRILGKSANAINFNGTNSYVSVSDNNILDVISAGKISISFWFKTNGSVSSNQVLVAKGGLGNTIGYSVYLDSTGKIVCGFDDDATSFPEDSVTSLNEYDDSQWHFVTCSRNSNSSIQLFVNASPANTNDTSIASTGTLSNATALTFGGQAGGNYFNGAIDDVRIFNNTLSSAQIGNLYTQFITTNTGTQFGAALSGWWRLNESNLNGTSGEVLDSSGLGNNGTSINAPLPSTIEFKDAPRSAFFDGVNDQIQIPLANDPTEYTISAWVRPAATGNQSIFVRTNAAGPTVNWSHQIRIGAGVFQHYTYDGATRTISGTTPVVANNWYHVVATAKNGGQMKLFVNGTREGTPQTNSALWTTGDQYRIGSNSGNFMGFFNGYIDDVRLYSIEFSESEVKSLYDSYNIQSLFVNSEIKASSDPVVHYKFDEKSGMTAFDNSTNNIGATLTNMDSSTDWVRGKVGGAIDFDGADDLVSIPQSSTVNLTGKTYYGIGTWINPRSDGESDNGNIWQKGNNYIRTVSESGGNIAISANFDLATSDASVTTTTTIPINQWGYLFVYYSDDSDDEIDIYYNGILLASSTNGNGSPVTESNTTDIGGSGSNNYDGILDNFKIYTTQLTSRDILIEYNQGSPYAYWKFDRGEGGVAYDYSGNNNHGTLTNMDPPNDWLQNTSCKLNKCIDFDGSNDRVDISDVPFRFGSQDFSYSVWYYFDGTNRTDAIMGKRRSVSGFQQSAILIADDYQVTTPGKKVIVSFVPDSVGYSVNNTIVGPELQTGWNHIAITKEYGQSGKLYLNGALSGSTVDTFTTQTFDFSGYNFQIGDANSGGTLSLLGRVDEVKVFRYALNQNDIFKELNFDSSLRFE